MVENPSMPTLPSHKSLFMDFAHGPCQLFWKRLSLQPGGRRLGKCFMVGKNNAATRRDPTFLQLSTKTHQSIRSSDCLKVQSSTISSTFKVFGSNFIAIKVDSERVLWCFSRRRQHPPVDVGGKHCHVSET